LKAASSEQIIQYADMFAAIGTESRLRIMQLLLAAHPQGMVVGEIQAELDVSGSNLSHHLDKLKNEDLVQVQREGTYLRYTANVGALQQLLAFLYSECCTRSKAISPKKIVNAGA
jgi:ArsR family transcriptional regulator, arsenate/arsenite/antimonite-responsive transcriptional repressor